MLSALKEGAAGIDLTSCGTSFSISQLHDDNAPRLNGLLSGRLGLVELIHMSNDEGEVRVPAYCESTDEDDDDDSPDARSSTTHRRRRRRHIRISLATPQGATSSGGKFVSAVVSALIHAAVKRDNKSVDDTSASAIKTQQWASLQTAVLRAMLDHMASVMSGGAHQGSSIAARGFVQDVLVSGNVRNSTAESVVAANGMSSILSPQNIRNHLFSERFEEPISADECDTFVLHSDVIVMAPWLRVFLHDAMVTAIESFVSSCASGCFPALRREETKAVEHVGRVHRGGVDGVVECYRWKLVELFCQHRGVLPVLEIARGILQRIKRRRGITDSACSALLNACGQDRTDVESVIAGVIAEGLQPPLVGFFPDAGVVEAHLRCIIAATVNTHSAVQRCAAVVVLSYWNVVAHELELQASGGLLQ